MKIGLFSDFYKPTVGGTETAIDQYYDQLTLLGHNVTIVAPYSPLISAYEPHVVRLPSMHLPEATGAHRLVLPKGSNRRLLDGHSFDIIHSHTEFGLGILAHQLSRERKMPHVHTAHTLLPEVIGNAPAYALVAIAIAKALYPALLGSTRKQQRLDEPSWIKRQAWSAMLNFYNTCDAIITPSQHLQEKLTRFHLVPPSYIHPNAVDIKNLTAPRKLPDDLKLEPSSFRMVCVGRISPEKRQSEVIRAFGMQASQDAQLLIVGDGPSTKACKELAATMPNAKRIIFTGTRSHEQVSAILQHSNAFVLASYRFDNQPIVVLEAISQGLPVLYCDPDLREGLSEENAILAAPDAAGLARGLTALIENPSLRKKLGRGSLKLSQAFDYKASGQALTEIYEKTAVSRR